MVVSLYFNGRLLSLAAKRYSTDFAGPLQQVASIGQSGFDLGSQNHLNVGSHGIPSYSILAISFHIHLL